MTFLLVCALPQTLEGVNFTLGHSELRDKNIKIIKQSFRGGAYLQGLFEEHVVEAIATFWLCSSTP